jgi:hypothetical protein
MPKVLAFDVSETLEMVTNHDDAGRGQPTLDRDGDVIHGFYSVLVGGQTTATLLREAQENGMVIVLVTNNGDGGVGKRTLAFLQNYGVTIPPENYLGPIGGTSIRSTNLSMVPRLEAALIKYAIEKQDLVFFADSRAKVEEAQANGFTAIRVLGPNDLQSGITAAIPRKNQEDSDSEVDHDDFSDTDEPDQEDQIAPSRTLAAIKRTLTELKTKIESIDQYRHPKAQLKALELLSKLERTRDAYQTGLRQPSHNMQELSQTFRNDCYKAVQAARPVLANDLGWGDYLKNLLKSLVNAVVWFFTGNETFFSLKETPAKEAVDKAWIELALAPNFDQNNLELV